MIPIPQHEELTVRSGSLSGKASTINVIDKPSYEEAAEFVLIANAFIDQTEDRFRDSKQKAAAAHRAICALEHSVIDPVAAARDQLKRKMSVWNEQQKREAEETNRRARMEAERQHAEEIERQAEEAELRGASVNEVRAILEQPSMAPAPVAPAITPVRGISTSEQWFGEITDKRAFVREALTNNMLFGLIEVHQGRLDQMVRSLKNALSNIPGLKIGRKQMISASRRG